MNYGLHLSAAGALSALYQVDVLSNNLANVDTVGFKAVMPYTMQREAARDEDNLHWLPSNRMLEALGGGSLSAPNRVDFSQGPYQVTGKPLDAAIEGVGFFMVGDRDQPRFTRDGRFSVAEGRLVMSSSGLPVLDASGRAIRVPSDATIALDSAGYVLVNGQRTSAVGVVEVSDPDRLVPMGGSLFEARDGAIAAKPVEARLRPGEVEGSSVDAISTMLKLTGAARAVGTQMAMIRYHDQMLDRAINTLGRVA